MRAGTRKPDRWHTKFFALFDRSSGVTEAGYSLHEGALVPTKISAWRDAGPLRLPYRRPAMKPQCQSTDCCASQQGLTDNIRYLTFYNKITFQTPKFKNQIGD